MTLASLLLGILIGGTITWWFRGKEIAILESDCDDLRTQLLNGPNRIGDR